MHPNASLHHCLPAGMRKTWLIFLTPCVEFYRLSCAPASQISAQTKMAEGVICLTAYQTEASCSVVEVLLHACTGDSVNPFVPNFLPPPPHPHLLSPPVESEFFSHNHWFSERLILKSCSFICPPSGHRVWLSVTDPERSRLILHKDR